MNGHELCFEEIRKEVIHYPSLKTVMMVEEAIEKKGEFKNKRQLWLSLSKQIMYQTLLTILDYLQASHKIVIDKEDGSIFCSIMISPVWLLSSLLVRILSERGYFSFRRFSIKAPRNVAASERLAPSRAAL